MLALPEVRISQSGLDGDRSRGGKRAVTIMQAEHLPVIGALLGNEHPPDVFRRNIVVQGLNVAALRGETFRIGDALLRGTVPCHPCSRMEEALGYGGYTAMRGHGGLCAEVLDGALIGLGSAVAIVEDDLNFSESSRISRSRSRRTVSDSFEPKSRPTKVCEFP